MKPTAILFLCLISTSTLAQEPIPADRITPAMLAALEYQFPEGAVDCFKESLAKAKASGNNYLFTADYQRGQLWLISMASLLGDEEVLPYICTPSGLASTPEDAMAAMFGGMGLPN